LAEVIEPKARSREEFIEECKSGAFDDVVIAFRTFMSVAITGLVDEELVSQLPKSLRFIAHNGKILTIPLSFRPRQRQLLISFNIGAGYDQVDVHACTAHNIRVSNVPTAVDDATADINMFLILGTLRGINSCMTAAFIRTLLPY
jgi:glyoxylate reductase